MPKTKLIIGYIRVSTKKQGESGLGLEAQQAALEAYAKQTDGRILKVYVEVETGKRNNRPQLLKALGHARRSNAVLAVGDLSRLSRRLHFITGLMESGVPFIDCQSPNDDEFVTHIRAAVNQEELRKVSRRTKAALAAYKARGGKLGASRPECRNLTQAARQKGARAAGEAVRQRATDAYRDLANQMREWRQRGMTLTAIASVLNNEGHTTRRGKPWGAVQVMRVLERFDA